MDKKHAEQSSKDVAVKLFRRGQLVEIAPPVDGLVGQFLSVQHVGRATAKNGFVIEQRPFPLVWSDEDKFGHPYQQTFAGLERKIEGRLREMGRKCVLTGDRPSPLPEPLWKSLPSSRTGDRRLLRFVQTSERGIIWYREGKVDIAWLIAQIALAYPQERIIVIVTRQADAMTLTNRLRRYLPDVELATPHHHPAKTGQVVVATPSGLQQPGVRIWERTTCICLNSTEVLNSRKHWFSSKDWLPVLKSRMYGLLNEDQILAPQQQDFVRACFGEQRLFIPRHGFRELPVTVRLLKFRGGSSTPDDVPMHELKRACIWRDPLRNRLIAGLAQTIVNEDDKALGNKYPTIAADLYSKLGKRVAILVENVEHAAYLLKRLPGWPIVANKFADTSKLDAKVQAALLEGQTPTTQKTADVIVTTKAFMQVGVVDVLIRADAGVALPPISSEFFIAGDGVPKSLTLIDVKDRHHPHLRRRAKWRKNSYLQRGWKVNGEWQCSDPNDPFDYPLSVFHPDRPRITSISYLLPQPGDPQLSAAAAAYKRRSKKRCRKETQSQRSITLTQIADHEFLIQCFKRLRQKGGWGAGIDNVTFSSLSPGEWAGVFRQISKALLKSRYRPQHARQVPIPKPGTQEKRILSIRSICDRVVALAVYDSLEPHLDKLFLDESWGFRPGRGTWEMLAHLKKTVEDTGRWVLVVEDVRKAFDNIRVGELIKAQLKAQQELAKTKGGLAVKINDSVLKLIAVMARGTMQNRVLGIDQGNNYSPTALNVVLHYAHDLPLTAAVKHPCWYRYADNLVYLCQNEAEGQQVLQKVQQLLGKAKLQLKGKDGTTDLRKNPVSLLGLQLREQNGKVAFTLTDAAWDNLKQHLAETHNAHDPAKTAQEVITGWVNAFGLAFENDGSTVTKVCSVAAQYGFRELDREQIEKVAGQAKEWWEKMIGHESAVTSPFP